MRTLFYSITFLTTLLCFQSEAIASVDVNLESSKSRGHQITIIYRYDYKMHIEGYISELRDSSIVVIDNSNYPAPSKAIEVPIKDIKMLRLLKEKAFFKNLGIGLGSGILVNLLLNLLDNDIYMDPISWGVYGLSIGAYPSIIKTNLIIDGSLELYAKKKKKLSKYYKDFVIH